MGGLHLSQHLCRFKAGQPLEDGALRLLEQLPGISHQVWMGKWEDGGERGKDGGWQLNFWWRGRFLDVGLDGGLVGWFLNILMVDFLIASNFSSCWCENWYWVSFCFLLGLDCWLLISVFCCWLLLLTVVHCWLLLIVDCWLLIADCWSQIVLFFIFVVVVVVGFFVCCFLLLIVYRFCLLLLLLIVDFVCCWLLPLLFLFLFLFLPSLFCFQRSKLDPWNPFWRSQADLTSELSSKGFWSSFNRPFFEDGALMDGSGETH